MIIVPSSAVETMGLGALGGLTAFGKAADGVPGEPGGEAGAEATLPDERPPEADPPAEGSS
jgi:hypothetical protein